MAKKIVEWGKPNLNNVRDLFTLKPGVNVVEDYQLEEALKLRLFQSYVDEGVIKIRSGPAPESLGRMKPVDAVALVKKTVDKSLLEKWFEGERREKVLEAIQAQVDAISKPIQKDEPLTRAGGDTVEA